MNLCWMRAICSASGRGVLIKAGGGVSAGSGRFSVLSCSGSPLPVDDAEVVLATTGVGGASPSAEVDGLSLSDRAAPALCTSAVGCPATDCLHLRFPPVRLAKSSRGLKSVSIHPLHL